MSIFNGKNIKVEIYGESHASEIGVNISGFPTFKIDNEKLYGFLNRRKASSGAFSTQRKESDKPLFSGLQNGVINGDFSAKIINENVKSGDYSNLYGKPRPSHADYAWFKKDGALDFSGGGRFSGRLTAPLCIAGGIAKQYLESKGIFVVAYLSQIGCIKGKSYKYGKISKEELTNLRDSYEIPSLTNKQEMLDAIISAKNDGDSVGGIIQCVVYGLNAGVGNNLFGGLEGKIAYSLYAVPAVKGVEFGLGFELSKMLGSQSNDSLYYNGEDVEFKSNNMGGINGGISNGEPITMSVAIKPTPSIYKQQQTVDLVNKQNTTIKIEGRHDSAIAVRAVPCIESAVALAILDEILGE